MDRGKILFFLSEVWRNFTRNVVMQLTAIGTVTVMILLLGTFLFARETLGAIGKNITGKIEISVYLSDKTSPADAKHLMVTIKRDPRVLSVAYIPRAEGLRQMSERLRGQIDTSLLTSNPLPDALRIRVVDPAQVTAVAGAVAKLPKVSDVEFQRDAVERLLRFVDVMGKIGLAFVGLLVLTAAIIISNTIRLTVYARRREIAIMQLVGASGTYIRLPFIFEGLVTGLAGALVAVILLAIGYWQLWTKFLQALPFLPLNGSAVDFTLFIFELLGVGALVGLIAAWFSVGRYLRA
jgi:cell division transport system permease protein